MAHRISSSIAIAYKLQIVYVKFIGTHKEYDAVDAETVDSTSST
jgi:mRNA interferase HigB